MTSQELFQTAQKLIPGGVNSPVRAFRAVGGTPFYVQKASGCKLVDADERTYIDYVLTWGPAILGHAPSEVVQAVSEAARNGLSYGTPHALEVQMAQTLHSWVPGLEKVRMVNSGTEATMSAIRLARGATGRDKIIKFEGCYHGHVDSLLVKAGSGALTLGRPDSAGVPAALAELTITLPFNDTDALRRIFQEEGKKIAGVILEPVPANAGLYLPEPGFLETLRELCSEYESILIFDEVMTGFRVARGGVAELTGITPDLTAMGKVIGGGLPVGAFGGKASIMDQLAPDGPVYQAGTLSGNPLALAAGLAQLQALESTNGWNKLEEAGLHLEEAVTPFLGRKPITWKRLGSMFCLYFTSAPVRCLEDAKTSNLETFRRFFHHCLENGVYFAPSQFEAGFLSTAHDPDSLAKTSGVVRSFLEKL
jgi:glutamate-1-semialdehyde 2,1-aminomutase